MTDRYKAISLQIEAVLPSILQELKLKVPSSFSISSVEAGIEGDIALVIFSIAKQNHQDPHTLAHTIGVSCKAKLPSVIHSYVVIKGFLNFIIQGSYWVEFVHQYHKQPFWGRASSEGLTLVEFSSPNTNKPLHLGHLRNNFLGEALARLLKVNGENVHKTCVVNDRGIHICKSMLAWQKYANGKTPTEAKQKGDHFVGSFYVKFETELKEQAKQLKEEVQANNWERILEEEHRNKLKLLLLKLQENQEPKKQKQLQAEVNDLIKSMTPLMKEARLLLQKWEQQDADTISLWKEMNGWVDEGFEETYQKIGTSFDSIDFESKCYSQGKELIKQGLQADSFYQKEDQSVWVDLTSYALDHKLLQRGDSTSVYITQDIGLVKQRYERSHFDKCIYIVGNEQDYHFQVLQSVLKKMNQPYADQIYHLSYGMVELPSGKMKSREGTVVDADDLIASIEVNAYSKIKGMGKMKDASPEVIDQLSKDIAIAALKFYMLRVTPQKKMLFNPEESIDLNGFTGPFVQYTYARIQSVLSKVQPAATQADVESLASSMLSDEALQLILHLESFPEQLKVAASSYDPSVVASFVYLVAKKFNTFYAAHTILHADTVEKKKFHIQLCTMTAQVIRASLAILGIVAPNRM